MRIPNDSEVLDFEHELLDMVDKQPSIVNITDLRCPHCGGSMYWDSDWYSEEYLGDGRFVHGEVYTCRECKLFINVEEHYVEHHREVSVRTDDMEEE